ncbi:MAG TPA: ANTAR domain-containing protein, partial [Jatrophihabitans sp.]
TGTDFISAALPYRPEIFQAQGMVKVQLGIDLGQAMVRLRAYAFAADSTLADVAREVVARRLVLYAQPDSDGSYDGP